MANSYLTNPRIHAVTQKVVQAAKETLGERLDRVVLYGSYARGDFDDESDIDFFVSARVPQEEAGRWRDSIYKRIPGIDLEYDMLVSVKVTGSEIYHNYSDVLPFYMNVNEEGVVLYA